MLGAKLSRVQRLEIIIAISLTFFIAEISVAFYTRSLALVADAFHYFSDMISFIVALAALKISERHDSPQEFSFGWQRTQFLGAFFNGVFLVGLGVSIFLQAIERFISLQRVEKPLLMLIVGCIGLVLNLLSAAFLHEHDHHGHGTANNVLDGEVDINLSNRATNAHQSHHHASFSVKNGRDHGMLGVLLHIIGDAINNIGVIVAALIIWLTKSNGRYYADPGISLAISVMILASALPLVKNSGWILLESAPLGLNLADVQHDIETVPGVIAVHELHVWRLNQQKSIASAHIVTSERSLEAFMRQAQLMGECLHAYGIHSVTLQPELAEQHHMEEASSSEQSSGVRRRVSRAMACQIKCGIHCEDLTCCG